MMTLFENENFRPESTGHDYDFVGTLEVKSEKPLTFFFNEELHPLDPEEEDCDVWVVSEDESELVEINEDMDEEEARDYASLNNYSYFTQSKDDKWMGFLSCCRERGWFLALIKNYCPKQLENIAWA